MKQITHFSLEGGSLTLNNFHCCKTNKCLQLANLNHNFQLITYHQKLESIQYNAALALTGGN